jgi:hypothetical protein
MPSQTKEKSLNKEQLIHLEIIYLDMCLIWLPETVPDDAPFIQKKGIYSWLVTKSTFEVSFTNY